MFNLISSSARSSLAQLVVVRRRGLEQPVADKPRHNHRVPQEAPRGDKHVVRRRVRVHRLVDNVRPTQVVRVHRARQQHNFRQHDLVRDDVPERAVVRHGSPADSAAVELWRVNGRLLTTRPYAPNRTSTHTDDFGDLQHCIALLVEKVRHGQLSGPERGAVYLTAV